MYRHCLARPGLAQSATGAKGPRLVHGVTCLGCLHCASLMHRTEPEAEAFLTCAHISQVMSTQWGFCLSSGKSWALDGGPCHGQGLGQTLNT